MRKCLCLVAPLALIASPATALHWTVDYSKSHLGFSVLWSDEALAAIFKKWTADIDFDSADLAHSRVEATVDLASEASDTPDNDDGLKGPEGFSVSRFPTATFQTTRFVHMSGNKYIAVGNLSLHGVTAPVRLPFELRIDRDTAHVTGKTTVLRTAFGLGSGEWAAPTPIAHEVAIELNLTATKGP